MIYLNRMENKVLEAVGMKIGLLLEGGGMRGLYTSGALDVFMQRGLEFDTVMGVSAGAIFGVNYKSHQPGRVLRYNKRFAGDKRYTGIHSLITTGDIMNKDFCFNQIVNKYDIFDFDTYKKSSMDFYAVVTNIETGEAEYHKLTDLRDERQMELLRASGSMPFVSRFVEVNGSRYLDGALSDSIPAKKLLSMGCDSVVVILTRPAGYRKSKSSPLPAKLVYRKYPQLIHAINTRYQHYNHQLDTISALENAKDIFVIRPSRTIKISRLETDHGRLQEMYDLGCSDAIAAWNDMLQYLNRN